MRDGNLPPGLAEKVERLNIHAGRVRVAAAEAARQNHVNPSTALHGCGLADEMGMNDMGRENKTKNNTRERERERGRMNRGR